MFVKLFSGYSQSILYQFLVNLLCPLGVNNKLPITFIVEDNAKSVCTPTSKVWDRLKPYYLNSEYNGGIHRQKNLIYYQYTNNKYPHAGAGMRVQF